MSGSSNLDRALVAVSLIAISPFSTVTPLRDDGSMDQVPTLWQGDIGWILRAPGVVRGRKLRYLLTTLLLEAGRPLAVRELVALCEAEGVVFQGRPSKIISDALRWEIGWGRVQRLGRGVYQAKRYLIPRSTQHWIAKRVGQLRVYLRALRAPAAESSVDTPTLQPWSSVQLI